MHYLEFFWNTSLNGHLTETLAFKCCQNGEWGMVKSEMRQSDAKWTIKALYL